MPFTVLSFRYMGESGKFQGSVWSAMQSFCTTDKTSSENNELWQNEVFKETLVNIENAQKSMAVLKKHLPKKFHPFIRFAQPKTIWYLNVERSLTATQLNWLLDDLCLRIAKDIGYAPRLKVMIHLQHWNTSGFALEFFQPRKKAMPTAEEADEIINNFLSK